MYEHKRSNVCVNTRAQCVHTVYHDHWCLTNLLNITALTKVLQERCHRQFVAQRPTGEVERGIGEAVTAEGQVLIESHHNRHRQLVVQGGPGPLPDNVTILEGDRDNNCTSKHMLKLGLCDTAVTIWSLFLFLFSC